MRESPDNLREREASALHASPVAGLVAAVTRPWGERTWLRVYSVAVAMAAFLSFTGAFGSGEASLWLRFTYWLVVVLGGTAAVQVVSLIMDRFVRMEPLPEAIVLFLAAMPAITLVVWALSAALIGRSLDAADLIAYVRPVGLITFFMCLLQYMLQRTPRQSHAFQSQLADAARGAQAAPDVPGKALRDRLPFKFRQADIYALEAEDHYLRVHTSAGDALVLLRLYDAIRELNGIEGSQTHRSWWVARDAVSDVQRADGRVTVGLKGGVLAPVSRTYARALKADGWF